MTIQNSLQLGVDALKAGNTDQAIEYLEQATRENPGDYRGFSFLGIAYSRKGLSNRAIGTLRAALQIRPNAPSIHYNLGLAYKADGFPDRAREHFEQALRIDPTYVRAEEALRALLSVQDTASSGSCAWHTGEPAVGECSMCHLSVCSACRAVVNGIVYCTNCAGKFG